MKLTLHGHDDRYAIEQLQMALFPGETIADRGMAASRLYRGKTWLTAVSTITLDGKTTRAVRRCKTAGETVRLRRQPLQQSYYLAAVGHLPQVPAWGALAGVRPTKITTKHLLEGGNARSADKLLKDVYFVTPQRCKLAVDCSLATAHAASLLNEKDVSLYVGIPFCPTRCAYCSFVSRTVGKRIFSLGLIRTDSVRVNSMQLFARALLGKFTIETMIPVYIAMMIFFGNMGMIGTLVLMALARTQVVLLIATRNNARIHDLLAGTIVVDIASQTVFRDTEELLEYTKRIHAERAAQQKY